MGREECTYGRKDQEQENWKQPPLHQGQRGQRLEKSWARWVSCFSQPLHQRLRLLP